MQSDQFDLLSQADQCPICEQLPVQSIEPGYKEPLVFLRCPNEHPYAACGLNLLMAVNHWNRYIEFQRQKDSHAMMAKVTQKIQKSFCRSCQAFTDSFTQFSKESANANHLGYVLVKQECVKCHLTKSQREAA